MKQSIILPRFSMNGSKLGWLRVSVSIVQVLVLHWLNREKKPWPPHPLTHTLYITHYIYIFPAILSLKAYIELFAGKIKKQTVNYKNFKQSTHAIMLLILLSSVSFHVALWPAYGWQAVAIMMLVGYGVLLQFSLLVPTYVQNIVGFVGMTFFIQEYV